MKKPLIKEQKWRKNRRKKATNWGVIVEKRVEIKEKNVEKNAKKWGKIAEIGEKNDGKGAKFRKKKS